MDVLDIARWQFAITTVYHFFFVPLTIGLAPLVAIMQTAYVRTGNERWLKLTKFFGKLLLINFSIGVVTGIVQEFQFGMNWSEYSRFVGDIFGAPLAMEALAAFFIESTFLGLWIFGWDKLPKKIHLACIWAVAIATNLSAFFIIAANSWMQHPVGAIFNPETGRAEMVDIGAVLTNSKLWAAFPHTIAASWLTAATFVVGIAVWWMVRLVRKGDSDLARNIYRPAVVLGLIVMVISGLGVAITGDQQAKLMFQQQPMKMAAAEGLCTTTEGGAAFTVMAFGDCSSATRLIEIPGLTSFLATGSFDKPLEGIENLQASMTAEMAELNPDGIPLAGGVERTEPVDYSPNVMIAFWSFRLMIGLGLGSAALAGWALWATRKGKLSDSPWLARVALIAIPTPFLASSLGWIFTEMGRQPWIVSPNPTGVDEVRLLTDQGISLAQGAGVVFASMVIFTLIYTVLTIIWGRLIVRYMVEGAPATVTDVSPEGRGDNDSPDRQLSFAY